MPKGVKMKLETDWKHFAKVPRFLDFTTFIHGIVFEIVKVQL